ncbi:fumarylacetoacetate hydrolase family protein [Naasia aerilata]|uniref:2-hydroxyhepta-2,4-diene-1,7-dioate isomerase n=1 Tax=Naasia aerilata TaxID=1162966 RepID=A0ABN6XM98_9MICO|nr:fumarylacetoacetate hydrolase family protein [Naasia aerilata]BDZ46117.1 2-hydroxyhepta-2,4-diene-1,7-dioate isomerase [Naasia aerilata]
MKIARFSAGGADPAFGILDEETDELVVLAGDPMFAGYQTTGERVALSGAKLLAPVIPRSKVISVALNYPIASDDLPQDERTEPLLLLKPNTSVVGPGDAIRLPPVEGRIVHEAELAIVIGRIAKQVPGERALETVFAYTVANDVTALDLMLADGQWTRAKGYDTFCPVGPLMETELDTTALEITASVDGRLRHGGNTRDMRFSIPDIIAAASDVWTLLPGDLILTGAPAIGEITAGQSVSVTVEGIGTLTNPVRAGD